jgi:hypothetical protein
MTAAAVGPNAKTQVGQRLISQEVRLSSFLLLRRPILTRDTLDQPLYIILNLGISESFQRIDYGNLKVRLLACQFASRRRRTDHYYCQQFPTHMLVDYVRVYQQEGKESITCDPPSHPTSQYIKECVSLLSFRAHRQSERSHRPCANFSFSLFSPSCSHLNAYTKFVSPAPPLPTLSTDLFRLLQRKLDDLGRGRLRLPQELNARLLGSTGHVLSRCS